MQITAQSVWEDVQQIRTSSPLIHNITNYVVMELTANGLLAIGASPVMAHAPEEVQEMTAMANSLVLNIGTLSGRWVESMKLALRAANALNIPVIFDPVGVGATTYRTNTAKVLLQHGKLAAIRGNASEITALSGEESKTKGVDSAFDTKECFNQAKRLALQQNATIWMSGKTDFVTDGHRVALIENGDSLMAAVTGMGCLATAVSAAFLAVNPDPFLGCAHAAVAMGVAGEMSRESANGPSSFKTVFIDHLHNLALCEIERRIRVQ